MKQKPEIQFKMSIKPNLVPYYIIKINKFLAKLMRKNIEKIKITSIRNEQGHITDILQLLNG